MSDVSNVRQIAQREGTISSIESRLNVDDDAMSRGIPAPQVQQTSAQPNNPISPLARKDGQAGDTAQPAATLQQPSDTSAQQQNVVTSQQPPAAATAQTSTSSGQSAQTSNVQVPRLGNSPRLPPTVANFPSPYPATVMYPHVPSSVSVPQRSMSRLIGDPRLGASNISLPCYYPSTWAMPSQSNLFAASR